MKIEQRRERKNSRETNEKKSADEKKTQSIGIHEEDRDQHHNKKKCT